MTQTLNDDLAVEDVIAYLRSHPDFFEDHPNLLKKLHLRHDSGNAISLMERQNQILRQENRQLIDRLNHFIQVAQRNDRLFQCLQRLVLALLPLTEANYLIGELETGLTRDFEVDETTVILCDRRNRDGDRWLQASRATLNERFPALMAGKSICGAFGEAEHDFLFTGRAVASMAAAPLTDAGDQPIGLLALGHRSASHFRASTDTLFLSHLARVVSQLLNRPALSLNR